MGVYLDASANEAAAAALLGASINYPMRGAVTWKSIVGTNVAADALSNLASAGVIGGALIVVGEDYGAGASVIQERTHSFALKSSLCLFDPRPTPAEPGPHGRGRASRMSEASNLPAVISLRIRAAHLRGSHGLQGQRAAGASACSTGWRATPSTTAGSATRRPPTCRRRRSSSGGCPRRGASSSSAGSTR